MTSIQDDNRISSLSGRRKARLARQKQIRRRTLLALCLILAGGAAAIAGFMVLREAMPQARHLIRHQPGRMVPGTALMAAVPMPVLLILPVRAAAPPQGTLRKQERPSPILSRRTIPTTAAEKSHLLFPLRSPVSCRMPSAPTQKRCLAWPI